ncbi:MAG: chemoreceptor glutamine deamidase CheD [Mariprofundaceae bacterium]
MPKARKEAKKRADSIQRLPGFDHLNSYYDKTHNAYAVKLLPGEYYVSAQPEVIVTVLGSCVSACIRDRVFGIGGMNHFMLPLHHDERPQWGSSDVSAMTRFGNYAMEHMIHDILRHGGLKKNLEIKLFGGGRINQGQMDVGKTNIHFVQNYLQEEGLNVSGHDLGGDIPRKVYYFPKTGRVLMKRLQPLNNNTIAEREQTYMKAIDKQPVAGEIDLFD